MDAAGKRDVDRELHAVVRIDAAISGETFERLGDPRVNELATAIERGDIAGRAVVVRIADSMLFLRQRIAMNLDELQ
jgi:hypothetical protein